MLIYLNANTILLPVHLQLLVQVLVLLPIIGLVKILVLVLFQLKTLCFDFLLEIAINVSKWKILVLVPAQILVVAWFGVNVLVVCLAPRLQSWWHLPLAQRRGEKGGEGDGNRGEKKIE